MNHVHVNLIADALLDAGAELGTFFAPEEDLAASFASRYPGAVRVTSLEDVICDNSIDLVVTAAIPHERAAIAVDAMRNGKHVLSDKPGCTSLDQLAKLQRAQAETGRFWSVWYERLTSRSSLKAAELLASGRIGDLVHVLAIGPHREHLFERPDWFYDPELAGGILVDIGCHQIDEFLFLSGSDTAEIAYASTANLHHLDQPDFEDFGEAVVRGRNGITGYGRVDWFTPVGLGTWGDSRTIIHGTDGFIEVRRTVDVAGRPGEDHLFVVDAERQEYIDCSGPATGYGASIVADVLDGTTNTLPQEHCFLVSELALRAQEEARKNAAGGPTLSVGSR